MIVDSLEHISAYRGLNANMNAAIDYTLENRLVDLPIGRYEIDGDRLYLVIQEPKLHNFDEGKYEVHRRYIDIQLILCGQENIYYCPKSQIQSWQDYDEEKDIMFSGSTKCGFGFSCTSA